MVSLEIRKRPKKNRRVLHRVQSKGENERGRDRNTNDDQLTSDFSLTMVTLVSSFSLAVVKHISQSIPNNGEVSDTSWYTSLVNLYLAYLRKRS